MVRREMNSHVQVLDLATDSIDSIITVSRLSLNQVYGVRPCLNIFGLP